MKRHLLTSLALFSVFAAGPMVEADVLQSLLIQAGPSSLTLEDDSREKIFDADGNGRVSNGDVIYGYSKIGQTSPPSTPAGNQLYAVFAQKFNNITQNSLGGGLAVYTADFTASDVAGYTLADLTLDASVSSDGIIAVIEKTGGFTLDGTVVGTSDPNVSTFKDILTNPVNGLATEGNVQFTAGLGSGATQGDDFFESATSPILVGGPNDPFAPGGLANVPNIPTSISLGNFGAGLSVIDNNLPFGNNVIFNETVVSSFFNGTNFFAGTHDVVVTNGNFGGTNQGAGSRVQDGLPDLLNNADLVLNTTVVPEPGALLVWGLVGLLGYGWVRRQKRRSAAD